MGVDPQRIYKVLTRQDGRSSYIQISEARHGGQRSSRDRIPSALFAAPKGVMLESVEQIVVIAIWLLFFGNTVLIACAALAEFTSFDLNRHSER